MEYMLKYIQLRSIWYLTGCLLIIVLFFQTCQKVDNDNRTPERVLLVYLAGDNNLSGESYQKLEAIRSGWDGDQTGRLLIWHDPINDTPALYEVTRDETGNLLHPLATYEEENSADPKVLQRVIEQMQTLYPHATYGMLLFSHASGWLPQGALSSPTRSVVTDGRREMELSELARAIPDSLFHFMVFEACYMAGVEVAYELRHKTCRLLVSSAEIVSPGFTHVYDDGVNLLIRGDLTGFARRAFRYFESGTGYINSATLSLIDTSGLEPLARFITTHANPEKEIDITTLQHFDRTSYRLFFDFGDYFSQLIPVGKLQEEFQQHLADCIPLRLSTPHFMLSYKGYAIDKHSGLTTYVCQKEFPELNRAYQQLEWTKRINGGK